MNNGLATIPANAVLSAEKIELLSKTIANGAPPLEFEMFVGVCNRTGLDPFAKQIYFIQRGGRWSWQTGIDGYRLIADRTGKYAGSDDPEFVGDPDGKHPLTAYVTVYKMVEGQRCPFSATARWSEYYPGEKSGQMWAKMPYLMLGKCAEALALRKAFPAELSGLYTREEMAQADDDIEAEYVQVVDDDDARQRQMRRLHATGRDAGLTHEELRDEVGVESLTTATTEQISTTADVLDAYKAATNESPEWANDIKSVTSMQDLEHVRDLMRQAGVTGKDFPMLLRYYQARANRLKIDAAKATKTAA